MPGLTLERLDEMEEQLKSGQGDPLALYDELRTSMGRKIWGSASWKKQRKAVIGHECKVCHTTEGPLVLQHLSHPPSPSDVMGVFMDGPWSKFIAAWELTHTPPKQPETLTRQVKRNICPKCSSVAVQQRKRMLPRFICRGVSAGRTCLNEWDEPMTVLVDEPLREENDRNYLSYREAIKLHVEKAQATFQKTAQFQEAAQAGVLQIISCSRDYVSLRGVETFCQKCAFLWDKKGLRPCIECGRRLAEPESRCSECSPDHVLCEMCGTRHHHRKYPTCLFCIHRQETRP